MGEQWANMRRRMGPREAPAGTWPDGPRYLERFGAFAGRPEYVYGSTMTAQAWKAAGAREWAKV